MLRFPETEPVGSGRDRKLIESAAYRPFQSAFGNDIFPTVLEKAAALFHAINADHIFENGCKRTSIIAVDLFLAGHWRCLGARPEVMHDLAVETADHVRLGISPEEMMRRIRETIAPSVVSIWTLARQKDLRSLAESTFRVGIWLRSYWLGR